MKSIALHGAPLSLRRPRPNVDDVEAFDLVPLGISLGEARRNNMIRVFVVYESPGFRIGKIVTVGREQLHLDTAAAVELRDALTSDLDAEDPPLGEVYGPEPRSYFEFVAYGQRPWWATQNNPAPDHVEQPTAG